MAISLSLSHNFIFPLTNSHSQLEIILLHPYTTTVFQIENQFFYFLTLVQLEKI